MSDKEKHKVQIVPDPSRTFVDLANGFTHIRILDISCTFITQIDISRCRHLTDLICSGSSIRVLDIFDHPVLENVTAKDMPYLHNAFIQYCRKLKHVNISSKKYLDMDLRGSPNLQMVEAEKSKLFDICLYECDNLKFIDVSHTHLKFLDLDQCPRVKFVNVSNSLIRHLYINQCHELQHLFMRNTLIESLDLLHCHDIKTLDIRDTQKLQRVVMHNTPSRAAKLYKHKVLNKA